ncbi:MAG: TolC family protein [Bacteroidales bacterium]|nr:TolC family protein [Bacteroidales bacterium]
MRLTLILFLTGSISAALNGQEPLTLMQCHIMARENAPRRRDIETIQRAGELRFDNAMVNRLPQVNLNGKATYQSDVVSVALEDPVIPVKFPEVPHDQYGLNLDLTQVIYDGGITRFSQAYEKVITALELQEVEVDLYKLKEQVNAVYFSILLLQANRRNLELTLENLKEREKVVASGVENGVLTASEIKVIQVEILNVLQSLIEIDTRRDALIKILGTYLGIKLPEGACLRDPAMTFIRDEEGSRPEYNWFLLQNASLDALEKLSESKRMPLLYAYGQAGYGKPGYNMLNNQWDTYYMVGAGLRWTVWDWKKNSRERGIIEQQKERITNNEASFRSSIQIQLAEEEAKIERYSRSLELDRKIHALQKEIISEAASKLENGMITASEFILELNREKMARIRVETNRILLNYAIASYRTINGTL